MSETPARILLRSRAPFDFRLALGYFRRRAGELVDATDGDAYRRLLALGDATALVEVRAAADMPVPGLNVDLLAGRPSDLPAAAAAVRRAFGLDDDLDQMHADLASDVVATELLYCYRGLRLVRTQSAFEALVWAIIGQ